jgi:lipopolysaccharide export system permease protein
MKKIIFKNISEDYFKFFLLSILSVSAIIWVLQAVNYLDFVIEDGHGFLVYLKYTLFSFPRIISRIFPFIVFFSMTYILLKYEYNNELVIFWNFGINKITFINFFIKFSVIFLLFNLLLNSLLVPSSQDKARSYIRSSDLDFLESILKPKKFIDVINNLTIYFESKTIEGDLQNILLKDNSKVDGFQLTFAKMGKFRIKNNKKILVLIDGKTLTKRDGAISGFEFTQSDFNMDRFSSTTTTQTKTQENSTKQLLKCLFTLHEVRNIETNPMAIFDFTNCRLQNLENIYQELYRRLILPFYCPLLFMIALLLIFKSKDEILYSQHKYKVFIFGFIFIIFLEISAKFISSKFILNYIIFSLPFLFYLLLYFYFIKKLNLKNT